MVAGGLGAEEEGDGCAPGFVECEGVLGGQFLTAGRIGGRVFVVSACLSAASY